MRRVTKLNSQEDLNRDATDSHRWESKTNLRDVPTVGAELNTNAERRDKQTRSTGLNHWSEGRVMQRKGAKLNKTELTQSAVR